MTAATPSMVALMIGIATVPGNLRACRIAISLARQRMYASPQSKAARILSVTARMVTTICGPSLVEN